MRATISTQADSKCCPCSNSNMAPWPVQGLKAHVGVTAAFWFADAVRLTVLKTRMHCRVLGGKQRLLNQRSECMLHNSDQYFSGSGCCILSTVGMLIVLPLSAPSQQAELALQEAIRIAQESNDHVCLQHCLVRALFKWALSCSAQ